jgi:2-polyprenyl-3-methyl-5-hydroxy-6-metoxy-1,4-benzoquinol methylase
MGWADQRSGECEILDAPDGSLERLAGSLRFMARVNRWLGGLGPVVGFLEQRLRAGSCSILDLGTGGGDIPFAVAQWAEQRGISVEITAIDVQPACLEYARMRHVHPSIRYVQHSAFDLEQLGSFDYITASMFFHHLPDEQIVRLLQQMYRAARCGFVVNDLYRHPIAYWGITAIAALTFNPVIFHDARLSVLRGFREENGYAYREWSGIDGMRIEQHPGFRFVMSYHH